MKKIALLLLALFLFSGVYAQKKQYKVACVGFYNLENLFDTFDDPETYDEEFTPEGDRNWTTELYQEKLKNLARVISELGTDLTPDGAAILGVAEVENRLVLEDLVKDPVIAGRDYQIVHFDSPDRRGIDVGLLYQPKYFTLTNSQALTLLIDDENGKRIYTRDILFVSGELDGSPLHVLVNHWPSRRGGEAASAYLRNAAATICKNVKDSLLQIDPKAKIIVMGDLNDDPNSPSVKKVLGAKKKIKQVKEGDFFNTMYSFFKKGIGTLAYRDAWSLFDQIIISEGLTDKSQPGYRYLSAAVHNKPYLIQRVGHFKGYPFRTFDYDNYIAGYSDHFPVYIYLVEELVNP